MPKRRRHEPIGIKNRVPALPSPNAARGALQHLQRRGHRRVGRVANLVRHLGLAECEEQRHGLGSAERRIEARDHGHRPRRRQSIAAVGMDVLKHAPQRIGVDLAVEPEQRRSVSYPMAGRLLRARVVLLRAPRDRVEVVLLLARREFPEAQHWPTAHVVRPRTARHAPAGASASSFMVTFTVRAVGRSTGTAFRRGRSLGQQTRCGCDALIAERWN